MKLTENEIIELRSLISQFASLHDEFDLYEAELEAMNQKQKDIIEKLNGVSEKITVLREKENKIISGILEKYGDVDINLETMELIHNK